MLTTTSQRRWRAIVLVFIALSLALIFPTPPASAQHASCTVTAYPPIKEEIAGSSRHLISSTGTLVCSSIGWLAINVCAQKHRFLWFWKTMDCQDDAGAGQSVGATVRAPCIEGTNDYRTHIDFVIGFPGHEVVNDDLNSGTISIECDDIDDAAPVEAVFEEVWQG